MIMDLGPYPAMKPSGVDWLGDVPEHWEVRRLKQICRFAYGDSLPADMREEGQVPVFGSNGRVGYHSMANTKAPCILVGRKGSFGKVLFSPSAAFAIDTTFYIDERLSNANLRWLLHLLSCMNLDDVTRDSAIPGLDRDEAYGKAAPLPPLDEQSAIVRYLDHVDRRISRYIRAKQRLIELLEEEKQVIIHRAVTRGLDPDVRLKPSGVEWLGDVPAHWEVAKIKQLARAGYRSFVDGDWIESPYITTDGIRLIQTGNIGMGEYREKGFRFISEETFNNFNCTEFQPGDVLICRLGEPVARACLAPQLERRMITSVDVCILKLRHDIEAQFVVYAMSSREYLDWVGSLVRGSTRDRVSRSMLGSFSIPLPSLPEQTAIARYLDEATANIYTTIARARRETELLREYRTRLIADVVTGKLDVRDVAADLPEVDPADLEDIIEIDDVAADELALELEEVAT